jgi:hypothetical protein
MGIDGDDRVGHAGCFQRSFFVFPLSSCRARDRPCVGRLLLPATGVKRACKRRNLLGAGALTLGWRADEFRYFGALHDEPTPKTMESGGNGPPTLWHKVSFEFLDHLCLSTGQKISSSNAVRDGMRSCMPGDHGIVQIARAATSKFSCKR